MEEEKGGDSKKGTGRGKGRGKGRGRGRGRKKEAQETASQDNGEEQEEVEASIENATGEEGKDGTQQGLGTEQLGLEAPAANTTKTPAVTTVETRDEHQETPKDTETTPDEEKPKKRRRTAKGKAKATPTAAEPTPKDSPDVNKKDEEKAKKTDKEEGKVKSTKQVVATTAAGSKEDPCQTKKEQAKKTRSKSKQDKGNFVNPTEVEDPETTKGRTGAKTKAKAKAKAKAQAEKEGGADNAKKKKEKEKATPEEQIPSKRQKTEVLCFARRRCPTTEAGKLKWITLKQVFQEQIKPKLTAFSTHEDSKDNDKIQISQFSFIRVSCFFGL